MTKFNSRIRLIGIILATSLSLQTTSIAYASSCDTSAGSNPLVRSQSAGYVAVPDTADFASLEQAVGLRTTEATTPSHYQITSPLSTQEIHYFRQEDLPQHDLHQEDRERNQENNQVLDENSSGHYINLEDMAAGKVPSSNILARADLLASASPVTPPPVVLNATITNDPIVAKSRVDDLTRQILLKIVELERFNLHYKQEVAKQGRWKGWRYAAWQETNGGLSLAGGIIGTAERGSHLEPTGKYIAGQIHTSVQENANVLIMAGNCVGALGAMSEFGVNAYHELQARHHGFSPGVARAKVNGLNNDINRMLAERDALTQVERSAIALQGQALVDDAEGKVLKDLSDQGMLEFERFHIAARKLLAFQQTQYFFDFAKYSTSAIGAEFAFLSLHKHDRKWNEKAGVLYEVSGGLFIFGPIISRLVGKAVGEAHRHSLRGTLQDAEAAKIEELVQDKAKLDQLCQSTKSMEYAASALDRANIYGDQSKVIQDELSSSTKEQNKAKLTATQNVGAGIFVGGLKLGTGITFNVVGYNSHFNGTTDKAGRVTNANLFAGAVCGVTATTFSMLDTLRIQVQGEINRNKLLAAGMHPKQLITARLAQLDDIERRLNSSAQVVPAAK